MTRGVGMLWYQAWTDTRLIFLLGLVSLISMAAALNIAFPGSPNEEFPHGALAVAAGQVRALPQDARAYIWLHWFANTLVIWLPVLAVALAGTGFPPRSTVTGGLLHSLTLPVPRRIASGIRISLGLTELAAVAVIPTVLVCMAAAFRGQSFSLGEGLVQVFLSIAGVASLYALFVFFSATLGELGKAVAGGAVLFLYGMFTFLTEGVRRYSLLRLMTGDMYFLEGRIPWLGIAASLGAALLLVAISIEIVERRDY